MLMNLAELAAYVRDVKPESDVHSNFPNQRSPLEKNNGFNATFENGYSFAAYAEPPPNNPFQCIRSTN